MPDFLVQYSLAGDPYELRELNPLTNPTDDTLLTAIVRAVPAYSDLNRLDQYLKDNAGVDEPVFLLVKGVDGCGRSSVANWLLGRYCRHRRIRPENFIVPKKTYNHNDGFGILKEWTGLLINQIARRKIPGPDTKGFWDQRAQAKPDDLIPLLSLAQDIASQLEQAANGPYGYGVCLEDIRVPEVVEAALAVFAEARTVCVLTVGEYEGDKKKVISFFEEYKEPIKKEGVRVVPLTPADVRELVRERWDFTTSKALPLPFPTDIDTAFAGQNRPVKRVMVLVGGLLRLKAAEHRDKRWPNDKNLAYNRDQLMDNIKILDQI